MLKRMRPGRPSPAMIVAVIALVGAFGGSAVADEAVEFAKTKLINGKRIKNRTISASKVKRNTLGGTEINESKLAVVPNANRANSAATADRATTATTADSLGGTSSTGFVKSGASAGGDLTGTFPNPTVKPLTLHSVGGAG